MVPRTFPSTYQTANGETRMVVFFLSSVSGLRKWVDYIRFFANTGNPYTIASRLVSGGTQTNPANTGSIAVDAVGKAALAYAVGTGQGAISVNGGSVATSNPAAVAVGVNALDVGRGTALGNLSGHIQRIAYYPVRLSNDQLQALTR